MSGDARARDVPTERAGAAILDRIIGLHPRAIDLSLDRLTRLLDALGRPEHRSPPIIHVAGTNGKGSLIAYLRAIFSAAGLRPHVYTSPHLVRLNERIVLAGREISDAALRDVFARCERTNAGRPITVFELITAAAFVAFAETPADVLLLEVGLGGRFDATNVVPPPLLTAITPISLDHQNFLGDTLTAIAGEKAGILKPGVPAIICRQPPEAMAVIDRIATELAAPQWRQDREWRAEPTLAGFRYSDVGGTLDLPPPALFGAHQIDNAAAAIAVTRRLGPAWPLAGAALAGGIAGAVWPARLQRLRHGPLVDQAPADSELWLDGGHNPGAAAALAQTLSGWRDRPIDLIIGMMATKDDAGFIAPLAPATRHLTTVTIPGQEHAVSADRLARIASTLGVAATAAASLDAAVAHIARLRPSGRILITGSLYLAGEVLRRNR